MGKHDMPEPEHDPPDLDKPLSKEELKAIGLLQFNLASLDSYANDFYAALGLFEYCENYKGQSQSDKKIPPDDILAAWKWIAARDGAMSIYHFAKCIEAIQSLLKYCPVYRDRADKTRMRTARRMFFGHFRSYKKLRHAIAHSAERAASLASFEQHATKESFRLSDGRVVGGPGITAHIGEQLDGRVYSRTQMGIVVSYEISKPTLQKLRRIVYLFGVGLFSIASKDTSSSRSATSSKPLPLP